MNRISIAEPCHENWAAMTPTEQGAFCGKCAVDVIDFSGKSAEEIKHLLLENKGKYLCGRFKKTQLEELNEAYLEWENQSVRIFQSKFLYACLLVFGMTLFSCNTTEEMVIGQVTTEQNLNSDSIQNHTASDSIQTVYKTGLVDYTEEENEEREYLKGKFDYSQQTVPVENIPPICESEELFTKGEISVDEIESEKTGSITVIEQQRTTELKLVKSEVYPNPAGMVTQLYLSVIKSGPVEISLYNLSGEKIQTIFSGNVEVGQSNFELDLSVLANGAYLIQVLAHGTVTTHKIVKAD